MSRTRAREIALHLVYEMNFRAFETDEDILECLEDGALQAVSEESKGWSLKRITRISRAVLRLALYEMLYVDDVPVGAAINEAVELAKAYDSDEAGRFVNGILGTVGRELQAEEAAEPAGKTDEYAGAGD